MPKSSSGSRIMVNHKFQREVAPFVEASHTTKEQLAVRTESLPDDGGGLGTYSPTSIIGLRC